MSHCLTTAPQFGVAMVTVPHWDARTENPAHMATMYVLSRPTCAEWVPLHVALVLSKAGFQCL